MSARSLETRFAWMGVAAVTVSAAALIAGLGLHLANPDTSFSKTLLQCGLVLLMATPVLRVLISTAERVRSRDWIFVAVTAAVLLELALSGWLASQRL